MKSNVMYLLRLWGVAGFGVVAVIGFFSIMLWRGNIAMVVIPIIGLIIAIITVKVRFGEGAVLRVLKSPSVDELDSFFKRTMSRMDRIPNGDAVRVQVCATGETFYGKYSQARETLSSIDWEQRPALIQASGKAVETLLCYFDTHDYETGLSIALSAQKLAVVSEAFPGRKKSAVAYEAYVEVGEILCNRFTAATVASLEGKLKTLPVLGRLLAAWGLMVVYRKSGENAKADKMKLYIHTTAPYCRALEAPPNEEALQN